MNIATFYKTLIEFKADHCIVIKYIQAEPLLNINGKWILTDIIFNDERLQDYISLIAIYRPLIALKIKTYSYTCAWGEI